MSLELIYSDQGTVTIHPTHDCYLTLQLQDAPIQ